jgi:hypothetical protein
MTTLTSATAAAADLTADQDTEIEHLLLENYRWQIRQSHAETLKHFYRPEDHTCRGYTTPATVLDDDEDSDDVYRWADNRQAEEVQLCIDSLPLEQRAAISTSMRNKESGRSVGSGARAGEQHANYQAAKRRLLVFLSTRGLIEGPRSMA